jgi:sulfur carrier protein
VPDSSTTSFEIRLNGEPHGICGDPSLNALIQKLKLRRTRIAIELNRSIVPKAEWDQVVLHSGDAVEIVNFVGGG